MSFQNKFEQARDFLILHRADYDYAYSHFQWPELENFNWALDYFDSMAEGNQNLALWLKDENVGEEKYSFSDLSLRSSQVANYFRSLGVRRGDHVLVMLGNETALWEISLALMKLGAVIIPTSPLLSQDELQDRLQRGAVRVIIAGSKDTEKFDISNSDIVKVSVGGAVGTWSDYSDSIKQSAEFIPDGMTKSTDPLLLYFTSGTMAKPKLVEHTHQSYPIGHLATMYWIGLRPGDIHANVSAPGWAKHAWSSFFAPWNAEATIFIQKQERFDTKKLLNSLEENRVTTFCAPPTVWRLLIAEELSAYKMSLREIVSAGEPLNPEIIRVVEQAWGLVVRDGYGQTETTALVANTPGQNIKLGQMGRALPGYVVEILDAEGSSANEGEVCVDISEPALGMMKGYAPGEGHSAASEQETSFYHTGDVAVRDEEGYFTFVGRADDIFKCSDYRISPFEVESILLEHPAVREVAVIPSPDPVRLNVPKAVVFLAKGFEPTKELALQIMNHARMKLTPYKRIRRIEFGDLPKTTSGKIRRIELRRREIERYNIGEKSPYEFWQEDFKVGLPETWIQDLP